MSWSRFVGNEGALGLLRGARGGGRRHHALLLHGPEGVGKNLAATLFAQSLLCSSGSDPEDPCGSCSSCRRVLTGSHPDFLPVGLAVSESTGKLRREITIDQVRELSRSLSFRPVEAESRVAVVDPADRLNAAAANAFLKTLEEPPGRAVIVLIASNPFSLLETIRSRCRPVRFTRVPDTVIERALSETGVPAADARLAAALADGAFGRARRLASRGTDGDGDLDSYRERRDRVLEALEDVVGGAGGGGTRAIRAAERFMPRDGEEFPASLLMAQALLRDALRVASGGGPAVAAADVPDRLDRFARRLGEDRAASMILATDALRADLNVNVNRRVAIESLLTELAAPRIPPR